MSLRHTAVLLAGCALLGACSNDDTATTRLHLDLLDRYETGAFDESAAEIVAFDAASKRLFVVNGDSKGIDVLSLAADGRMSKIGSIDTSSSANVNWGGANSAAVANGRVAVAIENDNKQLNGFVALYNAADLTLLRVFNAGALPDMLTFTPDGNRILVANEGEPDDDYLVDPEGSITLIDLSAGVSAATTTQIGFSSFNSQIDSLRAADVRIFGPGASVAQDLEPEYITVAADGNTAWVALQENNAMAVLDLASTPPAVSDIVSLGLKDHSANGNALDPSNRDDATAIANWPVFGMYMPDAIATLSVGGVDYVVTANEGDARDYDGYSEEDRVADLDLDANDFADAATLQDNARLGRLLTSVAEGRAGGNLDGDELIERIQAYGARSFSIWRGSDLSQVFDSGSDFEDITSAALGEDFNSTNDENQSGDNRSDDKGPEPEALALAELNGRHYAFIGLERVGGIMVYDVTEPANPSFVRYQIDRDFSVVFDRDSEDDPDPSSAQLSAAGDLGPEGMTVISAADSPTGEPLLVVASEVSGTTTVYAIRFR